ncbi:hypothetical protein [Photorhabdus akhurstii]
MARSPVTQLHISTPMAGLKSLHAAPITLSGTFGKPLPTPISGQAGNR